MLPYPALGNTSTEHCSQPWSSFDLGHFFRVHIEFPVYFEGCGSIWELTRNRKDIVEAMEKWCAGFLEVVGEGTAGPLLCFQTSVLEPGERGHYKARNQKKESQKEVRRGKNRAEKMWNWAEGVRGQPRQKESVLWCKCKNDVKGGNRKTDFQFMNNSVKGK